MPATLMVIGGSGFFGKSILDAHRRGLLAPWDIDRIRVVARSATALARTHPQLLGPAIELIDADAGRATTLPDADYVIHAASSTDAARYRTHPQEERANILTAIDNYCAVARASHPGARIVYCSSGAVYGQQPADLDRIDEAHRPDDASGLVAYKRDYAEAKRLAETRLAALGTHELRVTVARCFAFVGAYLPRDQHFAIGQFLADGLAGRPVAVSARKPVIRSWMHADDLVRWLMTLAAHADTGCPVYNVGSDEALTMGEAARIVAARFGVAAEIPPLTEPGTDRYVPDVAKARRELGLTLRYGLATAIDDVARRLTAPA